MSHRRAQLASSLLIVVGGDRLFGKVVYAKETIENYCGSELLWTIVDFCVVAYYGSSFLKAKWFKAYCEVVLVETEVSVNNEFK